MMVKIINGHTHALARRTTRQLQHRHLVLAISGRPLVLRSGEHVHRLRTLTTYDRRHAHAINGLSGIDVDIPGTNMHFHRVNAPTTIDRAHRHRLIARSRRAPDIAPAVVRAALRKLR